MNKKFSNRTLAGIILTIILVIVLTVALVPFSFFLPRLKENPTYNTLGQGDNPITITYTDCGEQNQSDCATISENIIPGDSITKTFELTNTGEEDANGDYNAITLYFKRFQNTFVNTNSLDNTLTSDLKYSLTEQSSESSNPVTLVNNSALPYSENLSYNQVLLSDITLKAGETKTYTLTITYTKYDSIDQESNRRASFVIELGIKTGADNFGTDTSGANAPKLVNNLIPVIYDENQGEWVITDSAQRSWYNYDDQIWANAVTIKDGNLSNSPTNSTNAREYYNNANVGTIVDMDDIVGMYVWIPRYEYKIEGTYGVQLEGGSTPSQATPGAITIKFLKVTDTKADKSYIMHPAFIDGSQNDYVYGGWDEELSGFWYGKFEASGTYNSSNYLSSSINVIPATSKKAVISLRGMATYHQFMAAKSVSTYQGLGNTLDSHMSKNDEWGAVAYLSQSVYGKYGNSLYTDANKEVFVNNYSSRYTGTSSGTLSASWTSTLVVGNPSTTNGTEACYYDILVDRGSGLGSCGGGASTTGNIYGVYDINGGTLEYTMAYLEGTNGKTFDENILLGTTYQNNGVWGATSSEQCSGWSNALYNEKLQGTNHKYYNAYTTTITETACSGGICYGHALSETIGWYSDDSSAYHENYSWLGRGGNTGRSAGIFSFHPWPYPRGCADYRLGFRVVLT